MFTPRRSERLATPKNDNRATDDKENKGNINSSFSPSTLFHTRSSITTPTKKSKKEMAREEACAKAKAWHDQRAALSAAITSTTQNSSDTSATGSCDHQSRTDDDVSTRSNSDDTASDSSDGESQPEDDSFSTRSDRIDNSSDNSNDKQASNGVGVSTQTPIPNLSVVIKREEEEEDNNSNADNVDLVAGSTQNPLRIPTNPSIKLEEDTWRVEDMDNGGYDDKSLCLPSSTAHSHLHEEKEDDSCESEDTFIQAMSKKHDDKTHDAGKERDNEDNWTSDNEATHRDDIRCLPSPVQSDSVYASSSRLVDTVSDSSLHDVNSYVDDVVQVADDEVIKHEHEKEDNSSDAGNDDQVSGDEIYEEEEDYEISRDYMVVQNVSCASESKDASSQANTDSTLPMKHNPDSLGNVRSEEKDNDGDGYASDGSHSSPSPVESYAKKSVEQSADDGEPSSLADTFGTYDLFGTPLSCDNAGNSPSIDWSMRSVESSSSSDIFDVVDKDALIAELQLENKLLKKEKDEALFFQDIYKKQAERSKELLSNEEEESRRLKLELAQSETSKEILQAEIEDLTNEVDGLHAVLSDENTRSQLLLDISNRGLAAKDAKIRTLQHQSNALNVENATLKDDNNNLNVVLKSMEGDVNGLTSENTLLKEELDKDQDRIAVLRNDSAVLFEEIVVLEEEKNALDTANTQLEKQLTTAKHEIASLKDSNGKLKGEKSVAKKDLDVVKQKRDNLAVSLAETKCQLKQFESSLIEETSVNASLKNELVNVIDNNTNLNKVVKSLKGDANCLTSEKTRLEEELDTTKGQIVSLNNDKTELAKEKARLEEQVDSVRNNLVCQLAKCQGQAGILASQLGTCQGDIYRLEHENDTLRREKSVIENKNEALNHLVTVQFSNTVTLGHAYRYAPYVLLNETEELILLEEGKLGSGPEDALSIDEESVDNVEDEDEEYDYPEELDLKDLINDLKSKLYDAQLCINELNDLISQNKVDSEELVQVSEENLKLKGEINLFQKREQSLLGYRKLRSQKERDYI